MTQKQKTDTQDRQTQLTEFKEYAETARALERIRKKYAELILKLKGAKKRNEKRNKNRISSVLFLRGSRRNESNNLQTKSHKKKKRVINVEKLSKEDIHSLYYDAVFTANKTECDHKFEGSKFESVNTTAWQKIGVFEKCREICTQCGKTVRTLIRIAKEA